MTEDRTPPYFEDLSVGATGPEVVVENVGLREFVRYAGASGDFNPMHYDEEYAQEAGFESIFGQGMLTAGVSSRMVREWVGLAGLQEFSTRFRDQVQPGDDLHARGEIVALDEDTGTVEGETVVETDDGRTVITGTFRAKLPRRNEQES